MVTEGTDFPLRAGRSPRSAISMARSIAGCAGFLILSQSYHFGVA
jgi:hypothetical protein